MTLNDISIATGGYVCGSGPGPIPIASDGYVCFAGDVTPPEEGGGSGGVGGQGARRPADGHGAVIPTIRLPRDIAPGTEYSDAELAALAILLIEEFYE